jgi:hypothetical protein
MAAGPPAAARGWCPPPRASGPAGRAPASLYTPETQLPRQPPPQQRLFARPRAQLEARKALNMSYHGPRCWPLCPCRGSRTAQLAPSLHGAPKPLTHAPRAPRGAHGNA